MFEYRKGEGVTAFFPTDLTIWFIAEPQSGMRSTATVTAPPKDAGTTFATCSPFKKAD